jgi:hypothetical protein
MKRRLLCIAAAAAALVPITAIAAAPPAQGLVNVCVTITPKFIGVEINGIPIGAPIDGQPRTCSGI